MKRTRLENMTVDQLVHRFRTLALDQDQALLRDDIGKVNELYDKLKHVEAELKSREGDRRSALLRLYDDPNPQVRVKAIKATLAVAHDVARAALEELAHSREYPQSGEAGMSIRALDRGIFKPT